MFVRKTSFPESQCNFQMRIKKLDDIPFPVVPEALQENLGDSFLIFLM